MVGLCQARTSIKGSGMLAIRLSPSNSSLSVEVRELKFCIHTPQINAKMSSGGFLKFCFLGMSCGSFLGLGYATPLYVCSFGR